MAGPFSIPGYVAQRVRQAAPFPSVVAQSTPVLAFGNPQSAFAATLGLNPSKVEFLNSKGNLLEGASRRLATLASLGAPSLALAGDEHITAIVADCNQYFSQARNPYRRWFDPLNSILDCVGASYYTGTACHLDLVQWATDPVWGKLKPAERKQLLAADAPFLFGQLRSLGNLRLLVLNGTGVVRELERAANSLGVSLFLKEQPRIDGGYQPTRIFAGRLLDRIAVFGWSTNIQSSRGVTLERRAAIGERLKRHFKP